MNGISRASSSALGYDGPACRAVSELQSANPCTRLVSVNGV